MTNHFFYFLFGIIPSIVWLSYYLKKDVHPEPKKKVIQVFLGGMAAALAAGAIETLIFRQQSTESFEVLIKTFESSLFLFLIVAFIEEILKYLTVKWLVFKDAVFDEPVDILIYMIVSALGFAALENVILFFSQELAIADTIFVAFLRFLGATFLHALCSGIFGFFIVLSFWKIKKRKYFFAAGMVIATVLHALYNFSIIKAQTQRYWPLGLTGLLLLLLAGWLSFAFVSAKKIKSVCQT